MLPIKRTSFLFHVNYISLYDLILVRALFNSGVGISRFHINLEAHLPWP